MKPLDQWRGTFGDAYTDRNRPTWESRRMAWSRMLDGLQLTSILEVGSNRGVNLEAIAHVRPKVQLHGLEPNEHARLEATVPTWNGTAQAIPFQDRNFDLVFTSGLLIHIPPEDLGTVLGEIVRVSRRYVLAIEYHADRETPLLYRGQPGLLWKRNYLHEYLSRFPLRLVRSGYWSPREGFDRCHWYLMEKV